MKQQMIRLSIVGFICAFLIDLSLAYYFQAPRAPEEIQVDQGILEKVRLMNISGSGLREIQTYCFENGLDFTKYLSDFMTYHDFYVESVGNDLGRSYYSKEKDLGADYYYSRLLDSIQCFPIGNTIGEDASRYYYTNSFLAPRSYGGDRQHMGIDIMDGLNEKGYFEIVSMTDGIVENLGWLELGGYRVGVRTLDGAYFYYAHLDGYAEGLQVGDNIKAGQLLGYMGSTGYGVEGTQDQFPVHLHMGICLNLEGEEVWFNPYPILQMVDPNL